MESSERSTSAASILGTCAIKSRDPVCYFLSHRENSGVSRQNRRTPSGFWKLTGESVNVNDRWGNWTGFRGKIGHKRVLVFIRGTSGSSPEKNKSEWVMHELHYTHTDLPEHKRTTYVICRLEYKGDDVTILSSAPTFAPLTMANSASSVVDQGNYYNTLSEFDSGHQFSRGIFDTHQSFPGYSDHNFNSILDLKFAALPNQSDWFIDLEQPPQVPYSAPVQNDRNTQSFEQHRAFFERELMDDRSHYRPKKSVTRILSHDSLSDSDTDSMIGKDAWSSTDSTGSKDVPYHTPSVSNVETSHNHEPQEQPKQLEFQGKEKVINKQQSECKWKMAEDAIKKAPSTSAVKQIWTVLEEICQRNSRWICLNNIIGLLLFIIFIIGWIILIG